MSNYEGYRITRHCLSKIVERGYAPDEQAAMARARRILAHPGLVYAASNGRATEDNPQMRLHDADDSSLVLIVDLTNRSVPTAYVSGHVK